MVATTTTTIYDTIGGKAALTAVVDEFYKRVLSDPLLAPLFANTDMKKQRNHQIAFLAYALGGPSEYKGAGMRSAHAGRGINDEHFTAVAWHLQATLAWAGVAPPEVDQIIGAAAGLHDEVVGH